MQNEDGNPLAIVWPYFCYITSFTVLFEQINNHIFHNYKQLYLIESTLSVPVPGTKEILQVALNERKCKIFFFFYIPILAIVWP